MSQFVHLRHKPPATLTTPRQIIVACAPLRSNINISNLVRTAGCCGVSRVIACGSVKIDKNIARDGADEVQIDVHRTLPPVLHKLKAEGYFLVGLEQTTNSQNIHTYAFPQKMVLVLGNERLGLSEEELACLDAVVEIPVWGLPYSYNVATSGAMALYEYCRQWPNG